MPSRVPWSRVASVDRGLLANVGEVLLSSHLDFEAGDREWPSALAAGDPKLQRYVSAVFREARRQWARKAKGSAFDVANLDRVIEQRVRGLQPEHLSAVVAGASPSGLLRRFLDETRDLLRETIDLI
jgi:hypothetical protein